MQITYLDLRSAKDSRTPFLSLCLDIQLRLDYFIDQFHISHYELQ